MRQPMPSYRGMHKRIQGPLTPLIRPSTTDRQGLRRYQLYDQLFAIDLTERKSGQGTFKMKAKTLRKDLRTFSTKGGAMYLTREKAETDHEKEEDYNTEGITLDDLIESLQQCISAIAGDRAIEINQGFLHDKEKCQIRLVGVMGRYKEKRRWIISEQDTRYENVHGDDAHYTHTCQYDQKTSTSVRISKGHKVGIGAGLGGSGYGASVMVTPSYEYSWGKDHSTAQEKGESKTSSVDITLREGTAVVVKEVVYNVEKTGNSKFNLILRKDEKIPYLCDNEWKTAKVKTLWETHLSKLQLTDSRFNWRESVEDGKPVLVCPFVADCCCFTTERSMETIKQVCDPKRTQRILSNY